MSKNEKKKMNRQVPFTENVKPLMEAHMICYIKEETFALLMENTWIGDSGHFYYNQQQNCSL